MIPSLPPAKNVEKVKVKVNITSQSPFYCQYRQAIQKGFAVPLLGQGRTWRLEPCLQRLWKVCKSTSSLVLGLFRDGVLPHIVMCGVGCPTRTYGLWIFTRVLWPVTKEGSSKSVNCGVPTPSVETDSLLSREQEEDGGV